MRRNLGVPIESLTAFMKASSISKGALLATAIQRIAARKRITFVFFVQAFNPNFAAAKMSPHFWKDAHRLAIQDCFERDECEWF